MTNIEQSVLETINCYKETDVKELEAMEESLKKFQKMVDDGIVKPRGYSVRTINDRITPLIFNR